MSEESSGTRSAESVHESGAFIGAMAAAATGNDQVRQSSPWHYSGRQRVRLVRGDAL